MKMVVDTKRTRYSGYHAPKPRTKEKPILLYLAGLMALVAFGIVFSVIYATYVPPGAGYVEGKLTHPAFYPSYLCNETKYVIEITSFDKKQAWSWYVSESVYDSYELGDYIGTLHRGSIYDEEVSGQ